MKKSNLCFVIALLFLIVSCQKEETGLPIEEQSYSLSLEEEIAALEQEQEVNLKCLRKPLCFEEIEEATGRLTRIDLRKKSNKSRPEYITIWEQEEEFNLLDMIPGIMSDIAVVDIPPGEYDLALIYFETGTVIVDGQQYDLNVPTIAGGEYLFLKFLPAFIVGEHLSYDIELSIDVSNSFIPKYTHVNGIKELSEFQFRPLVIARNLTSNGSIAGGVVDENGLPVEGATIAIENDSFSTSTVSYPTGEYEINGIPEGTYTATASSEGYESMSMEVEILRGNYIFRNFMLISQE